MLLVFSCVDSYCVQSAFTTAAPVVCICGYDLCGNQLLWGCRLRRASVGDDKPSNRKLHRFSLDSRHFVPGERQFKWAELKWHYPSRLMGLCDLAVLDLSRNELSREIPPCLGLILTFV